MDKDELAAKIEAFFLEHGQWELSVIPDGHPLCTPGRYLEAPEANFGFRPIDLVEVLVGKSR